MRDIVRNEMGGVNKGVLWKLNKKKEGRKRERKMSLQVPPTIVRWKRPKRSCLQELQDTTLEDFPSPLLSEAHMLHTPQSY